MVRPFFGGGGWGETDLAGEILQTLKLEAEKFFSARPTLRRRHLVKQTQSISSLQMSRDRMTTPIHCQG